MDDREEIEKNISLLEEEIKLLEFGRNVCAGIIVIIFTVFITLSFISCTTHPDRPITLTPVTHPAMEKTSVGDLLTRGELREIENE